MLRKLQPSRGPFPIGSFVYFKRAQVRPGESPEHTHRWFGPARVVGHEVRDAVRAGDPPGNITDAAPISGIWLRYGPGTVLAAPEQLRFASEDEMLAAHTITNTDLLNPQPVRGARGYVDIRADIGSEQQTTSLPGDTDDTERQHSQHKFDATAPPTEVPPAPETTPPDAAQPTAPETATLGNTNSNAQQGHPRERTQDDNPPDHMTRDAISARS